MRVPSFRSGLSCATVLLSLALARNARAADCAAAMQAEVTSFCGDLPEVTLSVQTAPGLVPAGHALSPLKCSANPKYKAVAMFAQSRGSAAPAKVTPPNGMVASPEMPTWKRVANVDAVCPGLVEALFFEPTDLHAMGAPPAAAAAIPSPAAAPAPDSKLWAALFTESSQYPGDNDNIVNRPAEARDALRAYRQQVAAAGGLSRAVPGSSTGLFEGVVTDALQELGQIVVDRASEQAYVLIKNKLEVLLGCNVDDYTSATGFNATCRVLVPLRIEDIAMSRDALLGALIEDTLSAIEKKLAGTSFEAALGAALGPQLSTALLTNVLPLIAHPPAVMDDSVARSILDALVGYAQDGAGAAAPARVPTVPAADTAPTPTGRAAPSTGGTAILAPVADVPLSPGEEVVVVAVVAYTQCLAASTEDPARVLAACDIGANVDKLAGGETAILAAAHALAQQLVAVATPTPKGSDPRLRLRHAVDTLFTTSCMVLRDSATGATPRLACDDPTSIASAQDVLGLSQPIVDDALNKDTNAMTAAIVHALHVAVSSLAASDHSRVFLILGGLLDYASTYTAANATAGTSTSAADQRTKVLESLTKTMTDRTGREGDTIVSLGGALRFVAGGRFALTESARAFDGPLSLPLGIAVTHIPHGAGPGFHMQIDVVDLGEYLAFDKTATVQSPDVADALAPGLTLGAAFGASFPFVVGGTCSFSPQRALDPSNPTKKGTFNAGITAGFHVPLLDMN